MIDRVKVIVGIAVAITGVCIATGGMVGVLGGNIAYDLPPRSK